MISEDFSLSEQYALLEQPEYTVHPNDIIMLFKANEAINGTVK